MLYYEAWDTTDHDMGWMISQWVGQDLGLVTQALLLVFVVASPGTDGGRVSGTRRGPGGRCVEPRVSSHGVTGFLHLGAQSGRCLH